MRHLRAVRCGVHLVLSAHSIRFLRFGLVGAVGTLVNMTLLFLLVAGGGWNHLVAAAPATECAILSNFALNDRWTFRDACRRRHWALRLVRYHAVALGGLAISLGVLAVLTLGLGIHYLAANLVAIGAGTVWNYMLGSRLAWMILRTGTVRTGASLVPKRS